jgi:hypothetical protein
VDFGIARLTANEGQDLQGLTRPGEVFGSPAYMSPEQTEGKAVTLASDIYSLGCTMYAALAGHAPFKGATAMQTMMAHQTDSPPPINRLDFSPEQNSACNEIIASCMEKAPEDRVSNVEQITEMLNEIPTELSSAASSQSLTKNQSLKGKDDSFKFSTRTSGNTTNSQDETTTNQQRATATNQKKWLIIAAISTIGVMAAIVAGPSELTSILRRQKEGNVNQTANTTTANLTTDKPTSAQILEASTKLRDEKMPPVSDDIDIEDYISRTNKELSEVIDEGGKKHRVFNFPTNMTIGRISPNKTREEQFKANSLRAERLDKPAEGQIIWVDAEPVNFIGGIKISKIPEIYEHFDDQAIASLTLKSPEKLPRIDTLAGWTNLQSLHLNGCSLDASYTKGLDKLEHLQSLSLDHTKLDSAELISLSLLARLKSLQLDSIEDHSAILHSLEYVRSLTYLELRNLTLNEGNMISLKKLAKLNELDLRYSTLPDTAMIEISKFPNLKILNLDRANYNQQSIYALASSKSLRTLYVDKDRPSEQILKEFEKRCPHIYVHRKPAKIN